MSSTILMVIVLVVMWLVVLVPMFVRRHEEPKDSRSRERIATAVRVLSRRSQRAPAVQPMSASRPAVDPAVEFARPRSVAAARVRADAHRRMLARRRRTLTALALLTLAGAGGGAVLAGWLWSVAVVGAMLFSSYLVWLRQQVRRQQERWQRRAAVYSRSIPSQPPHALRARPARHATSRAAQAAHPEPAEAVATDEPHEAADGSWQPTPVPVPTYVLKSPARYPADHRGRTAVVVELDDDDPHFAEIDGIVPPLEHRRAVNG